MGTRGRLLLHFLIRILLSPYHNFLHTVFTFPIPVTLQSARAAWQWVRRFRHYDIPNISYCRQYEATDTYRRFTGLFKGTSSSHGGTGLSIQVKPGRIIGQWKIRGETQRLILAMDGTGKF